MNNIEFCNFLREKCEINLTESQKECVFTTEGALCAIAVPGSGKTTAVVSKIAHLIMNFNVNPDRILALTFSRASAWDMRERFRSKFGRYINKTVEFSTIHAFSYRIIMDYYRRNSMGFILIEGDKEIIKNKIFRYLYQKYNNERLNDDKLDEVKGFTGFLKNFMIGKEKLNMYEGEFPVRNFKDIYIEYENIKRDKNYIDFDDMLQISYDILYKNPEILKNLRGRYDYLILDESQDTSLLQHEIVKLLCGFGLYHADRNINITLVADDDQSIYTWRGSDINQILSFKDNYSMDAKIIFMEQNFRSKGNIVTLANEFIKGNTKRYNKNMYTKNEGKGIINFIKCDDEKDEAEYISDFLKEKKDFKDVCVLYRNNISAIPVVDTFIKNNIPFYIKDKVASFFNSWVLKDICSFFDFAMNQANVSAFENIYYKIRSYISKLDIENLYNNQGYESVFDFLLKKSTNKNNVELFKKFKEKFKILSTLEPEAAINYIYYCLGYKEYLNDYAEKFNYSMDYIDIIIDTIKMVSVDLHHINDFSEKIKNMKDEVGKNNRNFGKNAVTICTMHSSKGLEFKTVFITDLVEGIIPCESSTEEAKKGAICAIEEERRLMYVGITRAKENLFLLYPKIRGGEMVNPSMFFEELKDLSSSVESLKGTEKNNQSKKEKSEVILKKGDIISHKTFGKGKVISVDLSEATVLFQRENIRKLYIPLCIEKGIISVPDTNIENV